MHTLIANPDKTFRILLHSHKETDTDAYITVERLEEDAIGAPQWALDVDGEKDRIPGFAVVAIIAHARPAALSSTVSTVLGTYSDSDGLVHRCCVVPDEQRRTLVHETIASDAAGAPRWHEESRTSILDYNGNPTRSLVDDTHLIACLFPS
jgi:hypothetical protein